MNNRTLLLTVFTTVLLVLVGSYLIGKLLLHDYFTRYLETQKILHNERPRESWEYGRLELRLLNTPLLTWHAEGASVRASSLDEFCAVVGCESPDAGSPFFTDLLDCVGSQGWELVYHRESSLPGVDDEWLFKRKKFAKQ